jgi:uncharacterized membrane protein
MEQTRVQRFLDRMAISASVLCALHCLVTPLLLIAVPVISSSFVVDDEFHKILVMFVLPVSLVALFIGCRRHKDRIVLVLGGLGLIALVSIAYFGHDLLGEVGEKVATVISGGILAIGHLRNYRLCHRDGCEV